MKAIKNSALGLTGIIGVVVSLFGFKVPFAESLAKEHWRHGLAALLLIILMIPAAIGLFLHYVDPNRFKAEIVHVVKAQTQRDLVLQGDIKLAFFPKLGLDLGRMSLSQRNSAKEFASINNARLYIAWLPLLKKQLVFDRVEIDGIRANVTRLKDGTTNFDDLLIRDENLAPMTFDFDGLRITNSFINWQDDMELQRFALRDLQLETGRLADTVPSHLTASFRFDSERVKSDAKAELKSSLFFDYKAGHYEFADLEGKLEGSVAGINSLTLSFKGNLDTYPAQGSLTVENVDVTLTGKYGQRNIEARLAAPRLQTAKSSMAGSQLRVDASLSQPGEILTAQLQLPAIEIANKVWKTSEFSADIDFKGDERSLQGRLAGVLGANFETAPRVEIGNAALSLAARHPALSGELAAKVTGSMVADFASQNVDFDFSAIIDESEAAGRVALKDFSNPAYTFELSAKRIDLDRYLAADWITRFQDDAMLLDFGSIRGLALNGRVRADEVKVAKLKAEKVAADIRIEQSALTVAPFSANLYGGTAKGSISVVAQDKQQITLKQNLHGFQAGALFAGTQAAGRLTGMGDLAVDIRAEGDTAGALRKSLSGSISLALSRGSLAGIDLRAALLEGRNDLGKQGEMRTKTANFAEKTGFTELKAAFNIKQGSSHDSFEMKSPLIRAAGEGDSALDSGSVGYRLNVTVEPAPSRRAAGELAGLRGVTVPIRVTGSWSEATIALDFAAASGDAVTRQIASRAAVDQVAASAAGKRGAPPEKRASGAIRK
jgi:AsmA protein